MCQNGIFYKTTTTNALRIISLDPNSIAFQRKNEISLTEMCVCEREREREKRDCKIRKWVNLAQTNTVKHKF